MSKAESENGFQSSSILTKLSSNPANGKSGLKIVWLTYKIAGLNSSQRAKGKKWGFKHRELQALDATFVAFYLVFSPDGVLNSAS